MFVQARGIGLADLQPRNLGERGVESGEDLAEASEQSVPRRITGHVHIQGRFV